MHNSKDTWRLRPHMAHHARVLWLIALSHGTPMGTLSARLARLLDWWETPLGSPLPWDGQDDDLYGRGLLGDHTAMAVPGKLHWSKLAVVHGPDAPHQNGVIAARLFHS